MDRETTDGFGELLRHHRQAAGLTQSELARRAGFSLRGLSDLERGVRRAPYPRTVQLLAGVLDLDANTSARLLAVVRKARSFPGARPAPVPSPAFLRIPLSTIFGRERERIEVRQLLEGTRLVTLTGEGGIGKTRLALAVADDLREWAEIPDGVWLAELAPLSDPLLVPGAVCASIGVKEQAGRPVLDTLLEALRSRYLLVVLDNCEHLVKACAALTNDLLRNCPNLRIMATSREPLRVPGE